jgi:transcriptional regulator of arginine metabolism
MPETASRRRVIRGLIAGHPIHSQGDLVIELKVHGYAVTQATVSRDLAAMGFVKDATGYVVRTRPPGSDGYLGRTLGSYTETFSASGNLVVVRTSPGAAQVVAAAIDGADLEGVLGTVAGDDTVIVVTADANGGPDLQAKLEAMGATG